MTTFGILGGGQLARMMAQAGRPNGDRFVVLDPAPDACASAFAEHICADWEDVDALDRLAEAADVVTFDFENVPDASARRVADRVPLHPSPRALASCQDRLVEKDLLRSLDIPTPDYAAVSRRPDLRAAIDEIGFPAVLKTRRFGYDGKGQAVLRGPEDLERAWQRLGDHELILEAFVPFDGECSVIAVRGQDGECRFWPLTHNLHRDGMLAASLVPAPEAHLQSAAEELSRRLLAELDYVGVMALELFRVGDALLANEIAPRVHNSGHWTIDGAETSQFLNHLNAVAGRPLGSTAMRQPSLMLNWIGSVPGRVDAEGVHWHDYDKAARDGRKVGHATLTAPDGDTLRHRAERLSDAVGGTVPETLAQLWAATTT